MTAGAANMQVEAAEAVRGVEQLGQTSAHLTERAGGQKISALFIYGV